MFGRVPGIVPLRLAATARRRDRREAQCHAHVVASLARPHASSHEGRWPHPASLWLSASALAARDMALAAASSACRSCTRDCSILLWATSMSVLFSSSAARRRRFSRSRPSKSSCVTRRAPRGAFSLRAHVSRRGLKYYKGALEGACPCGARGEGHAVAPHGSTPPPARASAGPLATRPAAWPRGTVLGSSCGRAALLWVVQCSTAKGIFPLRKEERLRSYSPHSRPLSIPSSKTRGEVST